MPKSFETPQAEIPQTEMPEIYKLRREELLQKFSNERLKDINIQRVKSFIEKEGGSLKQFIFIEPEELNELKTITQDWTSGPKYFSRKETLGYYISNIDLILIRRDKDYEQVNGKIFTEGQLVHELTHATSGFRKYVADEDGFNYNPRVGFALTYTQFPWGWFFEEGWADMQRANYLTKYTPAEQRQNLASALKYGDIGLEDTVPIVIAKSGNYVPVPLKYLHLCPKSGINISVSAFAAYAVELLCQQDPTWKQLIKEARNSSEGLRKFAQAVEKRSPGLYKKLQVGDYDIESFETKLLLVINEIAGGKENVIKAKGLLKSVWANILTKESEKNSGVTT